MIKRILFVTGIMFLVFQISAQSNTGVTSIVVENNNVSGGGFQSDVTISDDSLTIYSSADVSGIFKSTDGGLSYKNVNQGLKSPKVASLVITPDNDQILYAGTGDKGGSGGLFRSINGGDTWSLTKDGSKAQFAGNHSAKTDPIPDNHPRSNGDLLVVDTGTNPATYTDDIVIVGSYNKGVRIFTQGGQVEVSSIDTLGFVRSVAYDTSIYKKAYAAIQFLKSEFSGIYEIDFSNPADPKSTLVYPTLLPEGLTVLSSGHVYAAIGDGGIVKYDGNDWDLVNTGLDTGNTLRQWSAVTGYVKGNTDIIYAGVNNLGGNQEGANYSSVWRSINGGDTWKPLVDAKRNVEDKIYGQSYNWWYKIKGFPQAGLGKTNNVVSSIDVAQGNSEFAFDDIIYVSGRGGIWKSGNGGDSWVPAVYNMQATANNGVAVNPNKPSQVVIANTDYVLLETGNRFENSDLSRDKPIGSDSRGYDVIFDKVSDELILATGDRDKNKGGEVFIKSALSVGAPSDSSWTNTGLNSIVNKRVLAVTYGYPEGSAATNQVILAAVEGAGVYRYHKGSWSFTGLKIGATKRCNMIWPDNTNSKVVFLLDLLGGLYRSTDAGLSWKNIWPKMIFNNNDFYNAGYLTADDNDPTTIYISTQGKKGSLIGNRFKVYRLEDADTMTYDATDGDGITDISKHSGNKIIKHPGPIVFGPKGKLWLTEQQNSSDSVYAALYVMENPSEDLSFKDLTTNEYRNIAIQPSGIDASSDGHVYIAQNGTGLVKISYSEILPETVDLSLQNEVSEVSPNIGDVVTFTITVNNEGSIRATNVDVANMIPNGYTNITNISGDGSLVGSMLTWTGLNIAAGASRVLTFDAEVVAPGVGLDYKNIAEVTACDQTDSDSVPGNDDGDQDEDDEASAIVSPVITMSIGSTVFLDKNNNGWQDATDPGIHGLTVELCNVSGVKLHSTMTDLNGYYFFEGLAPGEYIVKIPTPHPLYNTSSSYDGSDDGVDGDDNGIQLAAGESATSAVISLTAGSESITESGQGGSQDDVADAYGDMTIDFGFFESASIGNFVWFDIDGNGAQDFGEPGLDGVTVNLLDANLDIIKTTTSVASTSANSNYLFEDLPPGDYRVQFLTPNAYTPVLSNTNRINQETSDCNCPNEDAFDNDADSSTGMTHTITLESGEVEDEVDAGFNLLLDVELVSFMGKYVEEGNLVKLEWIINNGVNNDYFEVQRSSANKEFLTIGKVDALSHATVESSYDFDDTDILEMGNYLYRLKQVDKAGSVRYSDVIAIYAQKIDKIKTSLLVYPNPTPDYITIDVTKNINDKVSIEIFDIEGKIVLANNSLIKIVSNRASIDIPLHKLPPATYIARIQVGKEIFAKKITRVN